MGPGRAGVQEWWSERPPVFPLVAEEECRLRGANPKSVFHDSNGERWLFKPQSLEQCMVDEAAASVARAAGVPSPPIFTQSFIWNGTPYQGTMQRMLIFRPSELSRELTELTDQQRQSLQQHQVVDWLLGNVDAHREQFVIMYDDTVVGIDKAQSLRIFPHDPLRWDFQYWPFNTKSPVYKYLFQGVQKGRFSLNPLVAIRFAEDTSHRLYPGFLHRRWQPFVSTWPLYRLVFATLSVTLERREAVEKVLNDIEDRKARVGLAFSELYFQRSESVW